jgi:hypothetical protein
MDFSDISVASSAGLLLEAGHLGVELEADDEKMDSTGPPLTQVDLKWFWDQPLFTRTNPESIKLSLVFTESESNESTALGFAIFTGEECFKIVGTSMDLDEGDVIHVIE